MMDPKTLDIETIADIYYEHFFDSLYIGHTYREFDDLFSMWVGGGEL